MDSPSAAARVPIKVHGLEPGLRPWLAGASATFEIPKSAVADSAALRHLLAFEKQRAPALLRHPHWAAFAAGIAAIAEPIAAWIASGGFSPFRAGVGLIQSQLGLILLFQAWRSWQTALYMVQCRDGGVYRDLLLSGEHPVAIVAAARTLAAANLRWCFPLMLGPAMGAAFLTAIGYSSQGWRIFASLPLGPLPWGLALMFAPMLWMLRAFGTRESSEGEFVPSADAWLFLAGNGTVGDLAFGWLRTMNGLLLPWGALGVIWFFVDFNTSIPLTIAWFAIFAAYYALLRTEVPRRIASLTPDQFADLFAVFAERGDARAVLDSFPK